LIGSICLSIQQNFWNPFSKSWFPFFYNFFFFLNFFIFLK
jgi:hypothetical protein